MRTAASALLLTAVACSSPGDLSPEQPPTDKAPLWPIVYQQQFGSQDDLNGFDFTDRSRWQWHHQGAEFGLELLGASNYKPPYRSPTSIALIRDLEVADFDLDVDLKQTGRNYGHRDMCLFFGFESAKRFYYTHLATTPDPNAHNVFRVYDAARTNIAPVAKSGIDWGDNIWHHVRIERRVQAGSIRVYWDGQQEPILETNDPTLRWGRIGFGSFDDSGIIANIVVRAPMTRSVSGQGQPF